MSSTAPEAFAVSTISESVPSMARTRPTKTGPHSLGVLELWIAVSFVACALLPIYLATSVRPTSAQKTGQALVFGWIFFTALPVLLASAPRRATSPVLAVYAVMALFSAPVITQRFFSLAWAFGDVLLLIVPALLGIALHIVADTRPDWPRKALRLVVGTLAIAAVVGSFFPDPSDQNRYAPPAPLLMAAVWVYALTNRGTRRLVAIAGIAVVAVLTLNSQWRSSAAVFLFIGVVTLLFLLRGHVRTFFALALGVGVVLVLGMGNNFQPGGGESNNRLIMTFQEGGLQNDSSTMFRFVEARAVGETVRDEWIPPISLLEGGMAQLTTLRTYRRYLSHTTLKNATDPTAGCITFIWGRLCSPIATAQWASVSSCTSLRWWRAVW